MTVSRSRELLSRVPEVTFYFWIVKVMSTTVGETAADFLATTLGLGLVVTSIVMSGLFIAALLFQFSLKRYVPAAYWLVVVLISVVGTLVSDLLVDGLGISLVTTSIAFGTILTAVFAAWYASERTLSIHSITTAKREMFYWAAILFTFAMGTSVGDMLAEKFALGYGEAVLVFGAAIAVVTIAYYVFKLNAIAAFWIGYILTRPLGASSGDLLSQAKSAGGLGLGTVGTSLIFLATIICVVIYMSLRHPPRAVAVEV